MTCQNSLNLGEAQLKDELSDPHFLLNFDKRDRMQLFAKLKKNSVEWVRGHFIVSKIKVALNPLCRMLIKIR